MISAAVNDSRVVILEEDFVAFRDADGVWSKDGGGLTGGDLADSFRRVTDSEIANRLRIEATTALQGLNVVRR